MSGYITIKDKRFKPYIDQHEIAEAVKNIAQNINRDLKNEFPVFLAVLNGSFMFASDLLKELVIPCELSFIKVASYRGTESTGEVTELIGLTEDLKDRTVVILEDIIDSGLTLDVLMEQLSKKEVKRIVVATALLKERSYNNKYQVDYAGFRIPDDFVIGYGMDYEGIGRNLKDIHVLA
jgi:hypoxanthine phosphoribosyltransferase